MKEQFVVLKEDEEEGFGLEWLKQVAEEMRKAEKENEQNWEQWDD